MALGAVEVAVACGAAYAAWRVYVYYTSLQVSLLQLIQANGTG